MFEPFARADQRRWGGVYLPGLLMNGARKSVEPMAARLGEDGSRQALAHFVTSSPFDTIDEKRSWGIEVPQVIVDGGYGDTAAFRLSLEEHGLDYVVGISTTTTAHPEDTQPCIPAYAGRGPRPVPAYPEPAQRVKGLVIMAGKRAARPAQWREGSRPGSGRSRFKRTYSRFVALQVRPAGREIRKATARSELPVR